MFWRILICAVVTCSSSLARCGEVLDRVVANVNGRALLQTEIDEELRYECFSARKSLADISAEDRKQALDRLIDQELLRQQMRSVEFKKVTSEEVEKALQSLKIDSSRAEESWSQALSAYGVTEAFIRKHVETELNELRFVDVRLRPSIQVDFESVRTYYQQQLQPGLPPGQQLTLREAAPQIREILVQQKLNDALESWLQALRGQAQIQRFPVADEASKR